MVYTHYWQVNQNLVIKDLLWKITEYVLNDGAEMVDLSSCLGKSRMARINIDSVILLRFS